MMQWLNKGNIHRRADHQQRQHNPQNHPEHRRQTRINSHRRRIIWNIADASVQITEQKPNIRNCVEADNQR